MKIGELAKRSGLAASRIRFYEASGLLEPAQRRANGYREYAPQALQTLEIIGSAQQAGFSLEEIRRLLPSPTEGWPHDELLASLKRKVGEIDAMQQRLEQNKARLLGIIASIEGRPDGTPCTENTERVLAQIRGRAKQA